MKYNNIHIIRFAILMLLVLVSCAQDEEIDDPRITKGNAIMLKFTWPESQSTRSTAENGDDNLNENKITTLDVFIYQQNGDACIYYQHIVPSPALTGVGSYSKILDITQESFALNVNHSIYIVANYTGTIPSGGISLTALKALSVSALDTDKKQDSFIMDGTSNMVLNNGIIVNKEIPVTLKRAAAKIRVSMTYLNGLALTTGANITKRVMKYATNSSLIETGNAVTPSLLSMTGFTNQNSGAGNTSSIIAYSYANDWNTTVANETYMIVNVPVTVSGINYPNNYYRVPVNYRLADNDNANPTPETEAARQALYKLERNRLYDITAVIDKLGSTTPTTAVELTSNFTIQDWTTKQILVAVDAVNFIYVKDKTISLPNMTSFTTTFQSSSADVQITSITVNGVASANGSNGVTITWDSSAKSGNITINSTLPVNFVAKTIAFTVKNGSNLTQQVTVNQYPPLYLSADISANAPGGSDGQNNKNMYIMTSLVPNYSTLPNPDEFDEVFDTGYTHYAPNPTLGISYADYIRANAILGYPLTDASGSTITTDENNRRISPRFILASQYGVTGAASYADSKTKCDVYSETDATTGLTYTDWRMPTLAELYMIDILQNIKLSQVKKILEGPYYWSARSTQAVNFMDPRVGNSTNYNSYNAAVRCVRDMKN
ncbi:fimbrial tip adhesin FimD [Dysgonomonas alginatilytica]|nr:fimbrial protein [Dysgonomonas alginatilytica]